MNSAKQKLNPTDIGTTIEKFAFSMALKKATDEKKIKMQAPITL